MKNDPNFGCHMVDFARHYRFERQSKSRVPFAEDEKPAVTFLDAALGVGCLIVVVTMLVAFWGGYGV